jgi:hypothetical protein
MGWLDVRIRASRRRRNGEPHGAALEWPGTRQRACSPRVKEHITRLVVEVGNRASAWRNAAVDAELAFGWWKSAGGAGRGWAAAVYLAAIEREEKAAIEYSKALEACCTTVP